MKKDEQINLAENTLEYILSVTSAKNKAYILNAYSQYKEYLNKKLFYSAEYILKDILASTLNEDSESHFAFLNIAISFYASINSYKLMEKYLKQYIEMSIKIYGQLSPETAVAFNILAELYYKTAQYKQSEPVYIKALTIFKKVYGVKSKKTASLYNNFAMLYVEMYRFEEAKSLYKRALVIRKNIYGDKHPNTAILMNNLGELYCTLGIYAKAEYLLRKALVIFKKETGPERSFIATVYNNLANLYYSMDKAEKAELFYKKAIKVKEIFLGKDDPVTGNSYNNLALLYSDLGRYGEAEYFFKKDKEITEKVYGFEHNNTAVSLSNLANLYEKICQYQKAEPLYKDAIKIQSKIFGKNHSSTAKSYNNLAVLYKEMGKYKEAEYYYKKSIKIREKIFKESHLEVAVAYNNLAELYIKMFRYKEAENYIKKAIEIEEKIDIPVHSSLATAYNNLAEIYRRTKNYEEAEYWYKKSREIREKIHGFYHENTSKLYNNLGSFYELQESYEKAEYYYLKSMEIKERVLGLEHLSTARQYINLMQLYYKIKNNRDALKYGYKAIIIMNGLIQKFSYSMTKESSNIFKKNNANYYDIYISIIKDVQNIQSKYLFPLIYRKQGEIFASNLKNLLFQKYASTKQINARKKYINKLKFLHEKIVSAQVTGKFDFANEKKEIQKKVIEELVKLEMEVLPTLDNLSSSEKVNSDKLSKHFSADELLIEYFKYWNKYQKQYEYCVLLAIPPNFKLKLLFLDASETIDAYVNNVLVLIREIPDKIQNKRNASIFQKLYKAIIQPIKAYMDGVEKIYICPDGELCKLPFEVLIKEKEIKYMGSIGDITWLKLLKEDNKKTGRIFADAAYDVKLSKTIASPIRSNSYKNSKGSGAPFKPLIGIEGKLVKNMLDHKEYDTILYVEEEFTKSNLIEVISPAVLHISTHAFFIEKNENQLVPGRGINEFDKLLSNFDDPMDRSGLAVSGTNTILKSPERLSEFIVTARDISNMNLIGTKLVVLSACETGLGEVNIGEGVYGLQRAFFVSGVKTIVMSLWKVSDIATTLFMEEFYKHILDGKSAYVSLRLAKEYLKNLTKENVKNNFVRLVQKYTDLSQDHIIDFILSLDKEHSEDEKLFEEPYYWASFICMGEGI